MRIVSLLPSATDIVCSLGLGDQLVGRTHECDWPPEVEAVPVMTRNTLDLDQKGSREIDEAIGTSGHSGSSIYALDTEALRASEPDLILTQELCEVCAVSYREVTRAARMLEAGTKVVSLEPRSIEDILEHVRLVGEIAGVPEAAARVIEDARRRISLLRERAKGHPARVFCVEWLDPIYAAGHWVPEQVELAGGTEVHGRRGEPSHRIEWEEVVAAAPEALVLLPCGLSIDRAVSEIEVLTSRPGWAGLPAVRSERVWAVDGPSYFNRPGPRVVRGAEVLAGLLNPDATPPIEPPQPSEAVQLRRHRVGGELTM